MERGDGTRCVHAGIPEDNFSVVWTGQLMAEKTEAYTFQIQGDNILLGKPFAFNKGNIDQFNF